MEHSTILVIGVGNPWRGDDAAGVLIARKFSDLALEGVIVREESGEGAALIEAWTGVQSVILFDAANSGAAPGSIHRLSPNRDGIPSGVFHYSTHAFSVAEAIELSRALGSLPKRFTLFGIEGKCFDAGAPVSKEVLAAVEEVAAEAIREIKRLRSEEQRARVEET